MENIIVAKPQLIIMPQENSEKPQPVIDWQQWSLIPAVKHNQFMKVDADLIHRFSRRMLTGLEDMCQKIERSRQTLVRQ
jgi:vitamin B12 transport system substrate-binding protein